ncbi:HD domain-containing protein [soil metagenome]
MDLEKSLSFIELLNTFRRVERALRVPGADRHENDAEHSYNLCMLAWYIVESGKLDLNKELVIKYALVHDLIEAYAGDTDIFSQDESLHISKHYRESKAALRLQNLFPEFSELHTLIHEYEAKENKESRFVYALDKIEPMLHIFEDKGRTWKENKITIQMLIDNKKDKVAHSPELVAFFDSLIEKLKQQEKDLF